MKSLKLGLMMNAQRPKPIRATLIPINSLASNAFSFFAPSNLVSALKLYGSQKALKANFWLELFVKVNLFKI
jgi:hypothetical protein